MANLKTKVIVHSLRPRLQSCLAKCTIALLLSVSLIGCGESGSDSPAPPMVVPQPPDADSDGVNDAQDICANTSANATVDSNGCAPAQLDTDDDGKNNDIDQCPATPQGEAVDILGCGIDTQGGASPDDLDNDSVSNANDSCEATPRDELVDAAGCSASQKDNDADGVSDDIDVCDSTPNGEPVDTRGCGINSETQVLSSAFVERDGLLVIELESTNYDGDWQLRTGRLSSGNAYLTYQGNDNFNLPAVDVITVPIIINQPGIYRFSWLNIIGEGDSPTEANDSWLQIDSENYYAKKISNAQGDTPLGHIVCPVGRPSSNRCDGEAPEGSSSQGWLKVYRTGSPIDDWVWRSFTSDNDPHAIFAEFDQAGQYNILISGRSFGHGIDRLVLYRSDNPNSNISEETAISLDRAESSRQ